MMRINYESWWRERHPKYPHTMLTEVLDPCKVQAFLPGVEFISAAVLTEDRPTMRIWGFKCVPDLRKFDDLLKTQVELLRLTVK